MGARICVCPGVGALVRKRPRLSVPSACPRVAGPGGQSREAEEASRSLEGGTMGNVGGGVGQRALSTGVPGGVPRVSSLCARYRWLCWSGRADSGTSAKGDELSHMKTCTRGPGELSYLETT